MILVRREAIFFLLLRNRLSSHRNDFICTQRMRKPTKAVYEIKCS